MSNLKKSTWVFIALFLSFSSLMAQNKKMMDKDASNNLGSIVNQIDGLSDDQTRMIKQMEEGLKLAMNDLRTQMLATNNLSEKQALREEMQQLAQSNQTSIKRLLTKEQQKEYNKLLAQNQTTGQRAEGKGKGRGQGAGKGRMR